MEGALTESITLEKKRWMWTAMEGQRSGCMDYEEMNKWEIQGLWMSGWRQTDDWVEWTNVYNGSKRSRGQLNELKRQEHGWWDNR